MSLREKLRCWKAIFRTFKSYQLTDAEAAQAAVITVNKLCE